MNDAPYLTRMRVPIFNEPQFFLAQETIES